MMNHATFLRQMLGFVLVLGSGLLSEAGHAAESGENQYAISGYQMMTVANGAEFEPAVLTLDATLPEDQLLTWPFLFEGADTTAEVTVYFNNAALYSFTHEEFTEGYWNYLYIDIGAVAGQTGELRLTLASESAPVTLILLDDLREADGWLGYFSGTQPAADLALPLNNIGEFNPRDGRLYTCLAVMANDQPSDLGGIAKFDIAFEIVSLTEGLIRVVNSRPFNPTGALTDSGETPSCSGQFETTNNRYSDTVSADTQTLKVVFDLIDGETLMLQLRSAEELK